MFLTCLDAADSARGRPRPDSVANVSGIATRAPSFSKTVGIPRFARDKEQIADGKFRNRRGELLAGSAVAVTHTGAAVTRLSQLTVGTDAGLRHGAPEQAVIGARHGRVRVSPYVLAFPVQG